MIRIEWNSENKPLLTYAYFYPEKSEMNFLTNHYNYLGDFYDNIFLTLPESEECFTRWHTENIYGL